MKKTIVLALAVAASAAFLLVPQKATAGIYTVYYEPCLYPVQSWPLCIPNGSNFCPTNKCRVYA